MGKQQKELLLGITRPHSLLDSKKTLPCGLQDNFILPHLFLTPATLGDFLAHHPWNVIHFDARGREKKKRKKTDTHTFSEWKLLHYSRNTKYIWQALETNTRRGLTSCFLCKSFQGTYAIWNVYLVSAPLHPKESTGLSPLKSQFKSGVWHQDCSRTHSSRIKTHISHLQSCRELYTPTIFCCTDKETPHSEARPPTADPSKLTTDLE